MSDRSNPIFLFRVAGGVEIHSTQNPRLKNFEFEELENGGSPPVEESENWLLDLVFGEQDEPESGGR